MKSRTLLIVLVIATIFFLNHPSIIAKGNWKEITPFRGDRITTLFLHSSGKIFAGTVSNGLYVSNDDGAHWSQCYNYRTKTILSAVSSITADSKGNIYISTPTGRGIIKSTDEGNSWTVCNTLEDNNSAFCLAADDSGNIYEGIRGAIYVTKDGGNSWSKIFSSLSIVRTIVIKNDVIYAAADYSGLYISKDKGKTWSFSQLPSSYYWSILPISEKKIFVAMGHPIPGMGRGIYMTTDGGKSWSKSSSGLTTDNIFSLQLMGDNTILASGAVGRVFKSDDGGQSWATLTSGKTIRDANDFIIKGSRIIVSTDGGGILISKDNGTNWDFSNEGLNAVRNRSIFKLNNDTLLVANNAGLYKYNTNTEAYIPVNDFKSSSGTNNFVSPGVEVDRIISIGKSSLLMSTYQGDLWTSDDSGNTWNQVNINFSISLMSLLKKQNDYIYCGMLGDQGGLYRTSDLGKTWNKLRWDFQYCRAVAYDKWDNLYVGNSYFLYLSTDNGADWKFVRSFDNNINDIFISSRNEIFVSTQFNGISHSTNAGVTWTNTILRDSSSKLASSVICYKIIETTNGQLLLSTSIGLYESTDNGINWYQRDDILKDKDISELSLAKDGSILAVAGGNAYELNGSITAVDHIYTPSSFGLYQNYPNPFNPITTISYSLPSASKTILKIYDLQGREIITLVNESQSAGRHSVVLSADKYNLSSGVYFYRLTAGEYAASKKFVLLK